MYTYRESKEKRNRKIRLDIIAWITYPWLRYLFVLQEWGSLIYLEHNMHLSLTTKGIGLFGVFVGFTRYTLYFSFIQVK